MHSDEYWRPHLLTFFAYLQSVTFNGTSDPEGCQALTEDLVDESLCEEQGYEQCFMPLERRIPSVDYMVRTTASFPLKRIGT